MQQVASAAWASVLGRGQQPHEVLEQNIKPQKTAPWQEIDDNDVSVDKVYYRLYQAMIIEREIRIPETKHE